MAEGQKDRHAPPPRPPPPQVSGALSSQTLQSTLEMAPHTWSFRDLQKVHDMAYRLVDAGLQADELSDLPTAIANYTEGLHLLDKALRVNCEKLSRCSVEQIEQAKQIQQKMNKTRQQIAFRLQEIQAVQPEQTNGGYQASVEPMSPPSYEDAISEPPSLPPSYEDDELTALGESLMRREISSGHLANAEELFNVPDGVQIFYITAEGYVSAPTYPTSLHVIKLMNEPQTQGPNGEEAPVFLHVGDWMYPLIPGVSPALHTNYGAYLFPDVTVDRPGAAVGLLMPDTLSPEERERFEDIVRSSTLYGEQSPDTSPSPSSSTGPALTREQTEGQEVEEGEKEPLDTAGKISKGILVAAEWIAWGVEKGAEKAGQLIRKGSEKFQERYRPADHEHKIDPKVQKGVMYAREATQGAVKVTGYIVNKLGEVTVAVAKQLAPHLRKHGQKILPKSVYNKNSQGKSTVDGVVEVAFSGLKGFSTVYLGLESAAKALGRCLADETVHIVKRKYGEEAGHFTENTVYTAGNMLMTAHNIHSLGPKAVAKRAAKETGKAVLTDYHQAKAGSNVDIGRKDSSSVDFNDKKQPPGHSDKK
ncbi:unnamed protein product [Candidula unifasciata]|uniref:MIT domain-containing protein n=1 Tax=Candidula unifasciata TaxID=100452 RepID=A0A8S3ZBA7_9EUPU|nr:unnamed protein product [Candidula unifasciata]